MSRLKRMRREYQNPEMVVLRSMLESVRADDAVLKNEFLETLVFKPKTAVISEWNAILNIFMKADGLLQQKTAVNSRLPTRRCYVGRKLVPSGEVFWGFLPPKNWKFFISFVGLQESGINTRWTRALLASVEAMRVQSQFKIISATQLSYVKNTVVGPLQLEGNMLKVIYLLFVCYTICSCCFIVETLIYKLTNRRSMVSRIPDLKIVIVATGNK